VASTAWASENNQAMKACLDEYGYDRTAPIEERMAFDFKGPAKCHAEYRNAVMLAERAELKDFLKHNPRYRVPGQSNNKCWGKPRVMPFESAYIKQTAGGFEAGVSYKDTLPAGCYENGPWDNRDAVQKN
jgi:hypothetical protein